MALLDQLKPGTRYGSTFQLGLLISDAWRADNWKDKLQFGLNPPVVLKTSKKISGE
jgi:hypothetical protein